MERSFIVYQGEDETPEFDLTEPTSAVHVIWEEIEAGGRAFRGESVTNSIPARDEQGETGNELNLPGGLTHISLSRGSRYEWLERVDTASPVRMAAGRIGTKDYTRGRQKASRAREVVMSNGDRNEELTEIIVDDWVRGSETDVARVLALITDYLSGTPRATTNIADTYVAAGNTVTMPAKTYDGMTPKDILSEIASMANKNFFVTIDDELWYDVNTSDSYVAGVRISDRPDEVTMEGSNPGPSTVRLYPSNTSSGSGSGESDDAPALLVGLGNDSDGDWTHMGSGLNYLYMYDTPAATGTGFDTGAWAVVNTGSAQKVGLGGFVHLLDGDLLSIVQNGGVIRGQHNTKSRHGIGINEAAQANYSEFSARVYRPGSGFVAQLTSIGDATGSVHWYANAAKGNRTFGPATITPYPSAAEGDYLVIDYGVDHQGPFTGGTGAQVYFTDTGSVDLPITDLDADSDSAKNSWWQLGPSEESLPTYPPKWDVGPASSEDGLELISGLRLYYGQEGAYVTADDPTTEAEYWHAERSFYTSDPAIDNPTDATVLAEAILQRLKFEERTYNVSIGPVHESHLGLLKPGQLIDIKARAIPDADDQFVTRRIAQLKWTTPRPGIWWARMQLDRPLKEAPYGVGPKESSRATSEHTENGSHPASNITIIDADGNFTSTDVEGALDELFDAIGGAGVTDHGALTGLLDDDHPQYADVSHVHGEPPAPGVHKILVKRTSNFTGSASNDSVPDYDTVVEDNMTDSWWDAGDPDGLVVTADYDGLDVIFTASAAVADPGSQPFLEGKMYLFPASTGRDRPIHASTDEQYLLKVEQQPATDNVNHFISVQSDPVTVGTGDRIFVAWRTDAGTMTYITYSGRVSLTLGAYIVGGSGIVEEADVMDAGRWEVIVSGTAPPVAVSNPDDDDWLYGWVSG